MSARGRPAECGDYSGCTFRCWTEWAIMAMIIVPGSFPLLRWAVGTGLMTGFGVRRIAISCLADIPLIASLGGVVPVGRFLC